MGKGDLVLPCNFYCAKFKNTTRYEHRLSFLFHYAFLPAFSCYGAFQQYFTKSLIEKKQKKTGGGGLEYQSLSTKKSHCTDHRMMKTENYVMVPFDSISLRTKFQEKKNQ